MTESSSPKLLIVVPTLDSYKLLPRLLSSLQQQTCPDWRLLFIDGPSGPEHRRWLHDCCCAEARCHWVEQDLDRPGIFGAMNQGFAHASPEDWLMFWGSDDWAAAPHAFAVAISAIEAVDRKLDLLVCQGRYADAVTQVLGRHSRFKRACLLHGTSYRRTLWYGSTPPHQATLFGPGARSKLANYAPGFRLSADLDYFLQISLHTNLCVRCLDLQLVCMADGGISGRQTKLRLQEVRRAYRRAFGWCWWFPYLTRYVRRLASLLPACG